MLISNLTFVEKSVEPKSSNLSILTQNILTYQSYLLNLLILLILTYESLPLGYFRSADFKPDIRFL